MIVDVGADFPPDIRASLDALGGDMWRFRPSSQGTTRALNKYQGELRESVTSQPNTSQLLLTIASVSST